MENLNEAIEQHMELYHNGEGLLIPTDMEEAIVGTFDRDDVPVAVMSTQRILDILCARFKAAGTEDPELDAREWFTYNIECAHMGPQSPIFIDELIKE